MNATRKIMFWVIVFGISANTFAGWPKEQILVNSPGQDDDGFGTSVSIDGDFCMVGAPGVDSFKGKVYYYRHYFGQWQYAFSTLTAPDGQAGDRFGCSVDVHDANCIVGAYAKEPDGAAYIFYGYTPIIWTKKQRLATPVDSRSFGTSVSIYGNYCVVGAPTALVDGVTKGTAYVYLYNSNSDNWDYLQMLKASDGQPEDQFGEAVSISDNYIIVGAPNDDVNGTNTGSVYVFQNMSGVWTEIKKISPVGPRTTGELFGISVSIWGNHFLVGALGDCQIADNAGAAYYYYYCAGSTLFCLARKLLPEDLSAGDAFGSSVSAARDIFVVGSYLDNDNGSASGSVYVYKEERAGFRPPIKLIASDGEYQDYYGKAVAIDKEGTNVVIGSSDKYKDPSIGSAYIYDITPPTADISGDYRVDLADFALLAEQWLDGFLPF